MSCGRLAFRGRSFFYPKFYPSELLGRGSKAAAGFSCLQVCWGWKGNGEKVVFLSVLHEHDNCATVEGVGRGA